MMRRWPISPRMAVRRPSSRGAARWPTGPPRSTTRSGTALIPFLSSWDRDQENSAFVRQELFRQAYSAGASSRSPAALVPFLSAWDRDKENSAFVGQEFFSQAYSTPPALSRPSSEQGKRAGPDMTDEQL